jgi:CRP-like cAMP-binding protein
MRGFFRRRKSETINDVIAQRDYGRALEMVRVELREQPRDRRLRLQLADVLILAGKSLEAAQEMENLADELAGAGFPAQAMALLRRVKNLAPGRTGVEDKLHRLMHPGFRREPRPEPPVPARTRQVGLPVGVPIGSQRLRDPEEIRPLLTEPAAPSAPRAAQVIEEAEPPARAETDPYETFLVDEEEEVFESDAGFAPAPGFNADVPQDVADSVEIEISIEDDLEEYFREPDPETLLAPPTALPALPPLPAPTPALVFAFETHLFKDLPEADRQRLSEALPVEAYEAGEILVSEGEAGESIYVLRRGKVRVYVKARDGRSVLLRTLGPGDFFGEIAVLTRKKRTATVVAAEPCTLLRIDRPALEEMMAAHPEVQAALLAAFDERAADPEETRIRGKKSRRIIPGRRKAAARKPRKKTPK